MTKPCNNLYNGSQLDGIHLMQGSEESGDRWLYSTQSENRYMWRNPPTAAAVTDLSENSGWDSVVLLEISVQISSSATTAGTNGEGF